MPAEPAVLAPSPVAAPLDAPAPVKNVSADPVFADPAPANIPVAEAVLAEPVQPDAVPAPPAVAATADTTAMPSDPVLPVAAPDPAPPLSRSHTPPARLARPHSRTDRPTLRPKPVLAISSQVRAPIQPAIALTAVSASPSAAPPTALPTVWLRRVDTDGAFEARVREAVQAAVRYPAAARIMGLVGRVRVLLEYRSGALITASLAQSAGTPMLDDAALAAVREARYPAPRLGDDGRLLRLLVWVEFRAG